MNDFHKMAAITSLKAMFEGSHFSICTVRSCMKMSGCAASTKDMAALEALHCVNFGDMKPELRNMLFAKTMEIFETTGFDVEVLSDAFRVDSKLLN